jgi:hypothetical protein
MMPCILRSTPSNQERAARVKEQVNAHDHGKIAQAHYKIMIACTGGPANLIRQP